LAGFRAGGLTDEAAADAFMDEPTRTAWRAVAGETAMDRAWRWCVKRTLREGRRSAARGRPISRPNLERLFSRHLARRLRRRATAEEYARRRRAGRRAVREQYDQLT